MKLKLVYKGGAGSGHHGHVGRPGKVGGSVPGTAFVGISADKLSEYMEYIHSIEPTLVNNTYGDDYYVRRIPDDHPDASLLRGLEQYERDFIKYPEEMGMSFEEFVNRTESTFQAQLATSDVFMRITPENLEEAIRDGNFENTFTAKSTGAALANNKISYRTYTQHRIDGEAEALGVPKGTSGADRPVYGYWSQSEHGQLPNHDSWLGQYGDISVKFNKDNIANDLTFTDSDSLDYSSRVRSSDWRNPSIMSSVLLSNQGWPLGEAERGPDAGIYWEAQIFNKSTSNIAHVYSKSPMSESLTNLLDEKGIPWTVTE